tara:strand:- start:2244 stop:2786 length:543 start_codon:yes stop_codon:yes gene_type:complete
MFIQIQNTPNPNSLKFIPEAKVSEVGPIEFLDIKKTDNKLIRDILSLNGVRGIFVYEDFLSVNKSSSIEWEEIKHIIISYINDFYSKGNKSIISKTTIEASNKIYSDLEKKIINILETKVRPAVSKDGGDITFQNFQNGIVTVKLQGSCSGCPSSTMTLKRGVENLLSHYVPEVKEVISN